MRARSLVAGHRAPIRRHFYDCSPEVHRALGEMYADDERFVAHYDRRCPGLARWLRDAIVAAADRG